MRSKKVLKTTARKTLAAMAGVTAAATGAAVAPAPAHAAPAANPEFRAKPVTTALREFAANQATWGAAPKRGLAEGVVGRCNGYKEVLMSVAPVNQPPGSIAFVRVPALDGDTNCSMQTDMFNNVAVAKLQDAINECAPWVPPLTVDGDYGPLTAYSVKVLQDSVGQNSTGVYSPRLRDQMSWPGIIRFADGSEAPQTGHCWYLTV